MERIANNLLITIVLLAYFGMMVFIAVVVGFAEKGSIVGYLLIAPMVFIPFGAAIYRIRTKEQRKRPQKK